MFEVRGSSFKDAVHKAQRAECFGRIEKVCCVTWYEQ